MKHALNLMKNAFKAMNIGGFGAYQAVEQPAPPVRRRHEGSAGHDDEDEAGVLEALGSSRAKEKMRAAPKSRRYTSISTSNITGAAYLKHEPSIFGTPRL